MIDTCSVFRYIEKECQKPEIIAPDILKYRDIAVDKIEMMEKLSYPGGREEKVQSLSSGYEASNSNPTGVRRNTNVTVLGRSKEEIRTELIQSAKNDLQGRLGDEHARTQAHTHARRRTHAHARTHAHTHTQVHAHRRTNARARTRTHTKHT